MRHPMYYIAPLILISLFWLSARPFPVNSSEINAAFSQLADTVQHGKDTQEQLSALEDFPADHLTKCNRFFKTVYEDRLKSRLELGRVDRMQLASSSTPQGTIWYLSQLTPEQRALAYSDNIKAYLGSNMTPQELIAYGERETAKALAELANLETDIIGQDLGASMSDFIVRHSSVYTNETDIMAAADARRILIAENFGKLFLDYEIPKAHIEAGLTSEFGTAIGRYDPTKTAFIFYWDGKIFDGKNLDFLIVHELSPGHHLQMNVAKSDALCKRGGKPITSYEVSFTEGWAAYVETLGKDLGLFADPEQELGRIDWNLIRSIRVVLDVRINHDGWSNEQVSAYWNAHMPDRLDNLLARETLRMREMPLQAISYKLGAKAILDLKAEEQTRLGDAFDIREFHDKILRMGGVPPRVLAQAYGALAGEAP